MRRTLPLILMLISTSLTHAQGAGDRQRGLQFATRVCAECHALLPGDTVSPRRESPPFAAIANSPGMTGMALAIFFQTPHKSMPDLIIAREDRDNVIAYILSLQDLATK